jgi:hypothetical protein
MAGTRRSARQAASEAPKYVDSSDDDGAQKRNRKKAPSRKRAREAEEGAEDEYVSLESDGMSANI